MRLNIDKKFVTQHIIPYLPKQTKGRPTRVALWRIIKAILYCLKTGCQWRELPMRAFCRNIIINWQTVYYHYNKWCKTEAWKKAWFKILSKYRHKLDMSSVALDGSHTRARLGGDKVSYQGRKKAKTTNILFLSDVNGIPVSVSEPISGKHNDVYNIEQTLIKMIQDMKQSKIEVDGLFLNADAGFDSRKFKETCIKHGIHPNVKQNKRNKKTDYEVYDSQIIMDEYLYNYRYVVERTNAWIDGFKALLVRYERNSINWISIHYICFIIMLIRADF